MNWFGWQIDYLLFLQNFRDLTNHIFDNFFFTMSDFGIATVTYFLLFGVYWCVNKKIGSFMINCFALSYMANIFLKLTFCIYRPWIIDSRVKPLEKAFLTAPGYSFPSGHTAGATSCWGSFAASYWNNKIIRYSSLAIILLVMLSRNYLGVHTPQDVIVSFVVGIAFIIGIKKLFDFMDKKEDRYGYFIVFAFITVILFGLYIYFKPYPIDFVNGELLYDPTGVKLSSIARIFNLFGLIFGCYLELKLINFKAEHGGIIEKICRLGLGLYILNLLDLNLADILGGFVDYQAGKCAAYFILGLFPTFIYPCFIKLFEKLTLKKETEVK